MHFPSSSAAISTSAVWFTVTGIRAVRTSIVIIIPVCVISGYTFLAAITGMRPVGIFLVGCLFGALTIGGAVIQTIGVSSYIAEIIQASTLIGALIAQFFFTYEIKGVQDG